LLIVAHALRHVDTVKSERTASPAQANTTLPGNGDRGRASVGVNGSSM
jgi:hypothetical protein